MFARIKKSGKYQYLQIVENRKEAGKVRQQVIATLGRLDQLQEKGRVETLIRSLSRFSENTMLILSGKNDISADAISIEPVLIFERLWRESGIQFAIRKLLGKKKPDGRAGMAHMRIKMAPGADKSFARNIEVGQKPENRVGVAVRPPADRHDRAFNSGIVFTD